MAQIEHEAAVELTEFVQRQLQLVPAIAPQRSQRVAGEALGVQPRGNVPGFHDIPPDNRHVLLGIAVVAEGHDSKITETRGHLGNSRDADADLVSPVPLAAVRAVAVDKLVQSRDLFFHRGLQLGLRSKVVKRANLCRYSERTARFGLASNAAICRSSRRRLSMSSRTTPPLRETIDS